MTTPLFLDNEAKISLEKMAMSIKLSDNADNWQQEVSGEIYKHLPYLSDYAVNVLFDRVNPERGYAYGSAKITQLSDSPNPAGPEVTLPLLVKDRLLQPLDIMFSDGKAFPLSEDRLRETLFNGSTFETSARKPSDQGMVDQLQPPIRSSYGYAGGETTGSVSAGGGFGKFASLCEAIAPTLSDESVEGMVDFIMGDEQLKMAAAHNDVYGGLVMSIADAPRTSLDKTAASLVKSIPPTVVQFTKQADGNFSIKWANADAWAPSVKTASPMEAQEMAGTDAVQGMQPGENVTLSTENAQPAPQAPHPESIQAYGRYQVMDEATNQPRVGWAFPVSDFDGQELGLFLFADGEAHALQDAISGVPAGEDEAQIPFSEPQGNGAFVTPQQEDGSMAATVPVTIQNQSQDPEGNVSYFATTEMGEQIELVLVPGLQAVQPMGEGKYGLPADLQFLPLGEQINLVGSAEQDAQIKEARAIPTRAVLQCTGVNEYHLQGTPFNKLASDDRQWLDSTSAEFLLVGAGLNQFECREKLAFAAKHGACQVHGLKTVIPLSEVHEEAIKEAGVTLAEFPYDLQRNLLKEAAALEDSETADKILAMNFLNPENVSIFASYLPQLDEAAQKLAEMLMAARMGMSQVDEGALERSMKNLEEVIKGLRALQQKQLL